jgi:hypothetical protein
MAKIIAISGRKQSGKNTVANFITGSILKNKGMIQDFNINNDGNLEIKTTNSKNEIGWGVLDLMRKDEIFINYAENELWPHVKIYHFADPLKEICTNLFNIDTKTVYGNDKQKNNKINLNWEDMPENHDSKKGRMTAREFMQHFGTNILRKMKDDIWVQATITRIFGENSEIAIIPDVRFPNEIEAIKDNGGTVIRLTRNVFNDPHHCESILDKNVYDWSNFDYVIENHGVSVKDLTCELNKINNLWNI